MTTLPIHACLDDLITALRTAGRAVLQAPPGAGKTTVVPLSMLDAGLTTARIVMLEPRRLAARAAAARVRPDPALPADPARAAGAAHPGAAVPRVDPERR